MSNSFTIDRNPLCTVAKSANVLVPDLTCNQCGRNVTLLFNSRPHVWACYACHNSIKRAELDANLRRLDIQWKVRMNNLTQRSPLLARVAR